MDEEEKWDRTLARRYAFLVGLRWGVLLAMITAGVIIGSQFDAGLWPAVLLGVGAFVVNQSLTKALAPWVWPDGVL